MFKTIFIAVLAALAVNGAQAQTKAAPANIRVVVIPVTNYTPLVVARDKGWFAEEGLNVTWTPVNQGAVAV